MGQERAELGASEVKEYTTRDFFEDALIILTFTGVAIVVVIKAAGLEALIDSL
jgi:hypothetical protein